MDIMCSCGQCGAHQRQDFAALDTGLQVANYAMSKAGPLILDREYARRSEKDGIISIVANPAERTNHISLPSHRMLPQSSL